MASYIMTDSSITVLANGQPYIVDRSHPNFDRVKEAIKNDESEDTIIKLADTAKALMEYSDGKVEVKNGEVYYQGTVIRSTLTKRIITMMEEGFNVDGMCKFVDNLYDNPSKTAVDELYLFLESCNLPITEDGHFLAYKKVRGDYKDIYSGTFDNSIGAVCQMPRNQVDDKRHNTCSQGLHFASYSYMSSYGGTGNGDRIVIVKINPADVVSIPSDYNNSKGRCWKYEVVNEVKNDGKTQIKNDCIKNDEAYAPEILKAEDDGVDYTSVKESKEPVEKDGTNYSSDLKALKKCLTKALYDGDIDVDEVVETLDGEFAVFIEEYDEDYRDLNFNQFANLVRDAIEAEDIDPDEFCKELSIKLEITEPTNVKPSPAVTHNTPDAVVGYIVAKLKSGDEQTWFELEALVPGINTDMITFNDYRGAEKMIRSYIANVSNGLAELDRRFV